MCSRRFLMRTEASASGHDRPPSQAAAGHAGASVRPTARSRPMVPVRIEENGSGFAPSDPYVRRFWVAAIGPAAITELLRLIRAAERGEQVRLPRSLPLLMRACLVRADEGALVVSSRLPPVPLEMRWRFPPSLAAEHKTTLAG